MGSKIIWFGLSVATLFNPCWSAARYDPNRASLPVRPATVPVSLATALRGFPQENLETKAYTAATMISSGESKGEQKRSAAAVTIPTSPTLMGPAVDITAVSISFSPSSSPLLWRDHFAEDLDSLSECLHKATQAQPDRVTPILETVRQFLPTLPGSLHKKITNLFDIERHPPEKFYYQPQKLTIESHKYRFLHEPTPAHDHPFLKPLNERIRALQELDTDPLLVPHPALQKDLRQLREHYQSYRDLLCSTAVERRARLLSLTRIHGEGFKGAHFISEDDAYHLLCTDFYALPRNPTNLGSSPVVGFNGIHFKKNMKKASGGYTLNPGMEWALYAFHQLFVGQGIPPSALLVIRHVPHKVPQEGTEAFKTFSEAADRSTAAINRKTAEEILSHKPELQEELKETTQDYVVQASRTIPGQTLLQFLESKQDLEVIDIASFSSLMLTSLLMNPADGKPDNYMVEEILPRTDKSRYRLVSIDNDWALAHRIVHSEQGMKHHFLEVKTILYCLRSLMDKLIPEEVRSQILAHAPDVLLLQWVTSLKAQERRYQQLLQQGILGQELYDGLALPLQFYPGMLVNIRNTFIKIQEALRRPSTRSHQDLLAQVDPLVATYHKTLTAHEDPLRAFQDIYSYAGKTALERVLPLETDSLKAETTRAGAYRNRTQTLEEAVTQLLQTTDLTLLSPPVKATLLDLGLSHWKEQAQQATHPSWQDPFLLHQLLPHNPSSTLTAFLINRVSPTAINQPRPFDPDKRTLLHLAILHGGTQTIPLMEVLLNKGAQLEAQDKQGLTPLDYVTRTQNHILLRSAADATLQTLRFKYPLIDWQLALGTIIPHGGPGYPVQGVGLGDLFIPEAFKGQLLSTRGEILPYSSEPRRRVVGRITASPYQFYFKVYPELPGLEEAVGILTRRILGWGAPHTELLRLNGMPVLVSQGVAGPTLKEALAKDPTILNYLDPESLSSMLLMAMITNPEDGKPDNYVVEEILPKTQPPRYRLVGIDNDHAFMPGVAREPEKKKTAAAPAQPIVQVKTILYCLAQMKDPVHPNTRQRFLDLTIGDLLEEWVGELGKRNTQYRRLFSAEEVQSFLEHNCYVGVPFEKGAIERLYSKLVDLQRKLLTKPQLTHWELLKELEPHLAHRYKKAKQSTVIERFKAIDGSFYGSMGETITTSVLLLKDIGIPLKESLLEEVRKDDPAVVDHRPSMALRVLQNIRAQHGGEALKKILIAGGKINPAHMKDLKIDAHLIDLLKDVDFRLIPKPDQEAILQTITGRLLRRLSLTNMSALTDALLLTHLRFDTLTTLQLKGCPQITAKLLSRLAKEAPVLATLTVSGSHKLTEVSEWGLFSGYTPLSFEKLETLNTENCPNLTVINLKAPSLQRLKASECSKLERVEVVSGSLQSVYLANTAVTDELMWRLLVQNPQLRKVDLQRCPQVTKWIQIIGANLLAPSWDLGMNDINDAGAMAIAEALKVNTTLQDLNLWNNRIRLAGIQALTDALKINRTLIKLDLGGNDMGNAEARAIADALKVNRTLTTLVLRINYNIGDEGVQAIADALKVNRTLTTLALRINDNIGDEGVQAIAEALRTNITLTYLDLNSNKANDAGVQAINKALAINRFFQGLVLRGHKIDTSKLKDIGNALKNNPALVHLDLGNENLRDIGIKDLAEILKSNTALTTLDLRENNIGNAGARAIAEAFKVNTTLQDLNLTGNKIDITVVQTVEKALAINRLFQDMVLKGYNVSLTALDLKGADLIMSNTRILLLADTLKANTTLTSLDLGMNDINDAGAMAIAEALKVNTTLQDLNLWNNRIRLAGIQALTDALKINRTLIKLDLGGNDMGNAEARAIADALKVNRTLTTLVLRINYNIGDEGVQAIADALKVNRTLTTLALRINDNIGDEGVQAIAEALRTNITLTYLDLNSNKANDAGVQAINKALAINRFFQGLVLRGHKIDTSKLKDIGNALKNNPALVHLDLGNENLRDIGIKDLAEILKSNTALTTLDLRENNIGNAGARAIAEAFKVNTTLQDLNLTGNKIDITVVQTVEKALAINRLFQDMVLKGYNVSLTALDLKGADLIMSNTRILLLADTLKANTTLTSLDLGMNDINDAGAMAIAEALKVNTTLQDLNLWNNRIRLAGIQALTDALKINRTLIKLDLGGNDMGNAEARAIADALKVNRTLTTLDLRINYNIGDEGVQAIAEALRTNTTLTYLDLNSNKANDAGVQAINKALAINRFFQGLVLRGHKIDTSKLKDIGNALKNNPALVHLDLGNENLRDIGIKDLAEILKSNTALTTLDLRENNIGNAGARAIADAFKVNTTLQDLNLTGNKIDITVVQTVEKALAINRLFQDMVLKGYNVSLTTLDLKGADLIMSNTRILILADTLKANTTLTSLDLSENGIEDKGAMAIAEALKVNTTLTTLDLRINYNIGDEGVQAIAEALKVNTTLQDLNLWNNRIRLAGIQALTDALKINRTLIKLDLRPNNIGDTGVTAIGESLRTNTILTSLGLWSNGIGEAEIKAINAFLERNRALLPFVKVICESLQIPKPQAHIGYLILSYREDR